MVSKPARLNLRPAVPWRNRNPCNWPLLHGYDQPEGDGDRPAGFTGQHLAPKTARSIAS